jgi:hypothetical protein
MVRITIETEKIELALAKIKSAQICHPRAVLTLMLEAEETLEAALAKQEQGEPYGYLKLNTGRFVNEVEGLNPMTDKRYLPLYTTPQPCQTCEALARTVMLDQSSHDTTQQRKPLSSFVNDAGINAGDAPHVVVEKLQRSIDRANCFVGFTK